MKILDVPQGSMEWLQARAGLVTASRIADVMGDHDCPLPACQASQRGKVGSVKQCQVREVGVYIVIPIFQ